jgi:hypothetical protein
MSDYSTSRLAIVAVTLIVVGALVIFLVVDWIGGLLVLAGVIVGFVVLMRFVNEAFD